MKKTIILVSIISAAVVLVVLFNFLYKGGHFDRVKTTKTIETTIKQTKSKSTTKNETIIVEIKGAVNYPGVYEFNHSDVRIYEVIEMAGGLTPLANTDNLNLAEIVETNSSIYISKSVDSQSYTIKIGTQKGKININTASLSELMTLSGIGERKAQSIITYRNTNGFFKSIEELTNVDGIGNALFESIKEDITV